MTKNEKRLRERRAEILIAGDGTSGMDPEQARKVADEEAIEMILQQDGDHLIETDPDLFDENGDFLFHRSAEAVLKEIVDIVREAKSDGAIDAGTENASENAYCGFCDIEKVLAEEELLNTNEETK